MWNISYRDGFGRRQVRLLTSWEAVLELSAELRALHIDYEWGYVTGLHELFVEPRA